VVNTISELKGKMVAAKKEATNNPIYPYDASESKISSIFN
jgi:hypothetical protein